MSNQKNNKFAGEHLTPEIARKAIYELGTVNRTPPEVGIFDSPTRCFIVNTEWWAHIAGMVHLLADVTAWQEAENEEYFAIREILKFMQGMECMDFQLRQNPTDDCLLEQTTDGGETWTTAFDFSLCLNPKIAILNSQLATIEIQNMVNDGFSPTQTTIFDNYPPEALADEFVAADVCDTGGKDEIYGAIDRLVRYIHAVNVDFLQEISQAANVPEQASRFVSAVPGVGLLPFDELLTYTSFIVNELLAEYNATADETLLQTVICDLFCIAVNTGCVINLFDIYEYFKSKTSPSLELATSTLANLVQFAITGTFSGDDYFYFLCFFQLSMVALKSRFLATQATSIYAQQLAAGFNSPDNDWEIFCVDCPTMMRKYVYDLKLGLPEGAILDSGTFESNGLLGVVSGSNKGLQIRLKAQSSWRLRGVEMYVHREGSSSSSGSDFAVFRRNTQAGVASGSIGTSGGIGNGDIINCRYFNPADTIAAIEYMVTAGVSGNLATDIIRLEKIVVYWAPESYKPGAVLVELEDICS